MNGDDGRLIARFQRLITELLIEKQLGQRRPELTDELYQAWLEVDQRGLKETPEYRNVMQRAERHALWLAELVMLSNPNAASPLPSKETETIATDEAAQSPPAPPPGIASSPLAIHLRNAAAASCASSALPTSSSRRKTSVASPSTCWSICSRIKAAAWSVERTKLPLRPRMRTGGSMTKSVIRNKRPAGGRVPHEVG